jgi:hypothetical protein
MSPFIFEKIKITKTMVSPTKLLFFPQSHFQSISMTWSSREHIPIETLLCWLVICMCWSCLPCLNSCVAVWYIWVCGPTQHLSFYIVRLCLPHSLKPIITCILIPFSLLIYLKFHLSIIYPYATFLPPSLCKTHTDFFSFILELFKQSSIQTLCFHL